jgi:hypothetical protein
MLMGFTVRVQLTGNPSDALYNKLHDAMAAKDFHRKFQSNQKVFWMPHAEYRYFEASTLENVATLALSVADTVQKNAKILVTEGQMAWRNLDPG